MKFQSRRFAIGSTLIVALALGGCTNGSNATAIPVIAGNQASSGARAHARPGRLVLHIVIPRKQRHHHRGRKPRYISPATQSITVTLTGPTAVATTAPLTPTSKGCTSGLASTFCTLSIPGLAPGNYTGSVSTWDTTNGTGHELSANQNVSFKITKGQANPIGITLGGIPTTALIVPDPASSLTGSMSAGFTLSKCGSDTVSVYGVDAGDNIILGAGAPTPSLQSDTPSTLAVSTPSPSSPNAFTIVRPSPPPNAGSTVHLTATITPDADSGASPVSTSAIAMTFNHDICGVVTEFSTGITSGAHPANIAAGPDGNLWFTERSTNSIGRITPEGTVTEFSSGITSAAPYGIVLGPDGNLWFTERDGVARITTNGTVTEYAAAGGNFEGITVGPDGNLWFVGYVTVASITTSGSVTEYTTGITHAANLQAIAAGPDGNLWFTEADATKIGKITTSGTVTEFSTGITASSSPWYIVAGSDRNLWFTESNAGNVGKITTGGIVTEYSDDTLNAYPFGITAGPDGNLWFTTENSATIAKITTDGVVTTYPIGVSDIPTGLTFGPDGNLWYAESNDRIARVQ